MRLRWIFVGSVIALASVGGCGKESPPRAPTGSATVVGTARVPAGTIFTVRTIDPLSTDTAVAGRVFTARLREPLMAKSGEAIAPAGGIVTGRIVAVHRGAHPRLALAFDTLETYEGVAVIDARGESPMSVPLGNSAIRYSEEADADLVLVPRVPGISTPGGAIGGGPAAEEEAPKVITVEYDTELEVELRSPLVVPRTK